MNSQTTAGARERYLTLIEATLRHALNDRLTLPFPNALSMELAVPAIAARLGIIRKHDPYLDAAIEYVDRSSVETAVVDGAGQSRAAYRPLLFRMFERHVPRGTSRGFAAEATCATSRVESFIETTGPLLAADGADVNARLFESLSVLRTNFVSGNRTEGNAVAALGRVVDAQCDDGRFLTQTSADQLEPAWYHELATLHAVTLFTDYVETAAPQSKIARSTREAVRRSARYHAAEVQPDHASSHPFGLAALLDDADGIHLADMMLHAAGVQQPAKMDAVSLVLLFDALDCERRVKPA